MVQLFCKTDEEMERRQIAITDADWKVIAFTDDGTVNWKRCRVGDGLGVEGTMLVGPVEMDAMCESWITSEGGARVKSP